jgi:hypothetical protein
MLYSLLIGSKIFCPNGIGIGQIELNAQTFFAWVYRSPHYGELIGRLQPIRKMLPHELLRALCIPRQQRSHDSLVLSQ